MFKFRNTIIAAIAVIATTLTSVAYAGLTDLKIGEAQIFDVQYYWSNSSNPGQPDWSCYGDASPCDTLNVSGLTQPYASTGPGGYFSHPTLTSGQYYGFINSPTVPGTYGMAVFNSDGTQAYVIHNTGDLYKMSNDGIFFVGGGFFGTVITPSTGYSYGSSATLNVGTGTPDAAAIAAYTPPSAGVLTAGQTASPSNSGGGNTPTVYNITDTGANANFATGTLGPWTAGGGTGTQSSTAYSDSGVGVDVVQAMTSYTASGSPYQWTVTPPTGTYMVSIQPTNMLTSGVNTFDDMATDLGISAASKNEIIAAMVATGNGQPTNAAWIRQDITLTNGQTFHMAWQYISTDYVPFNDGSITTLVNKTGTIVATVNGESKEYALLGFTNPGTGNYSVGSYGATGWQLAQYTANEAGTYRLGFGAFNLSDTALSPILFVTKDVGTTLNFSTPFGPIAPNAGSNAPNNSTPSGPTVVSTGPGTPIVTSSSVDGTPVVTTVTNTNLVNSTDSNGNPVVTTYFTVTTTTTTPTTTTTVTTPVTVTTYSDGSTTTTNGTPVTTTAVTNNVATSTTDPAVQSVATTEPVATTSTTSGTATTTTSTVNWTPIDTVTKSYTSNKEGNYITVAQTTTTITDHPSTVTTTVTTPITTTTTVTPTTTTVDANGNVIGTSEGTPTSTDTTINQEVSSTQDVNTYTSTVTHASESVNISGSSNVFNEAAIHPFTVNPLAHNDGSWAEYTMGSANHIGNSGLNFGYQKTVGDNTAGIAGSATKISSDSLTNSNITGDSYGMTAYALNKSDDVWVKGAVGFGLNNYVINNTIASFGLANQTKAQQKTAYADMTVYSAKDYAGWKPFAGATVINSDISNVDEMGTALLSSGITASNKTYVMPYVGVQNEVIPGVTVEAKVTQTEQYGAIASGKIIAKKNITEDVSINISAGIDKGQNYDGLSIMAGLVVKF
jgi:hypothetical protein